MAIVESEAEVEQRSWGQRILVDTPGCLLRLVRNNPLVSPLDPIGSFVEANYPGYEPLPTRHKFSDPEKIAMGIYEMRSTLFHFAATGGGPQIIYGWLLTFGDTWRYYDSFPVALAIQPGSPIDVGVQLRAYARQIFPCVAEGET